MTGIGFDRQGNIYTADYGNVRVPVFDKTGEFVVDGNGQTGRLAIDEAANFYIPDFVNGHIQKFDGNGKSPGRIGEPGLGRISSGPGVQALSAVV